MSWFSKNFEKAALGGAVVVALGLGYLGYSKLGGVDADFVPSAGGQGGSATAVAGADLIPKAKQSLALDRSWTQGMDGERPVDLFTGIPLFIKSAEPEKAIDLDKGEPVHADIPNKWFLDNRIDLGYADSPDRDPDADGFSNIEEFKGGTDPNNGKSTPDLVAKLKYVKDESLAWAIRPGFGADGAFPFSYRDNKARINKVPAGEMVKPGDIFFAKEPMVGRFKLLGSEVRKELNKKINVEMDVTYVRIEDQKPNKDKRVYEIPAPLSEDRMNDFLQFDRTAIFSLEALGQAANEFKVEENTTFGLPANSTKKDFLLKQVTPEKVVIEAPDGKGGRKTIEISKGSLPRTND